MILRKLSLSDEAQALTGHEEFAKENWEFLLNFQPTYNWAAYLEKLELESEGKNLAQGRVQATFLVAEVNGILVGRSSIRHSLNEFLLSVGGHIGFGVRPDYRGNGYAKEILKQSLVFIRNLGVNKVLLTCDESNIASTKVIESQGGILENLIEYEGTFKRRYWTWLA